MQIYYATHEEKKDEVRAGNVNELIQRIDRYHRYGTWKVEVRKNA